MPTNLANASNDLATSEQILVRSLPLDALAPQTSSQIQANLGLLGGPQSASGGRLGGRGQLVPPSSHTPALSARAPPTLGTGTR